MGKTTPPFEHFQGKSIPDHLREARARGAAAAAEIHGTEMPGHLAAFADASKETAFALLILWVIFSFLFPDKSFQGFALLFTAGWLIWKTGRSALLGWARIERLHRVTEEERWEIEHHRSQEKLELAEMYHCKGLEGKLLEEVVDVMMADDNRLLRIMLEEELGLTLEVYEHPLKQALGAFLGVAAAALFCFAGTALSSSFGLPLCAAIVIGASTRIATRLENNRVWSTLIWNLAIAGLTAGAVYYLIPLLH